MHPRVHLSSRQRLSLEKRRAVVLLGAFALTATIAVIPGCRRKDIDARVKTVAAQDHLLFQTSNLLMDYANHAAQVKALQMQAQVATLQQSKADVSDTLRQLATSREHLTALCDQAKASSAALEKAYAELKQAQIAETPDESIVESKQQAFDDRIAVLQARTDALLDWIVIDN